MYHVVVYNPVLTRMSVDARDVDIATRVALNEWVEICNG